MRDLAAKTLSPQRSRVRQVEGYIDDAPTSPADGATGLLTLHFLEPESGSARWRRYGGA